MSVEFRKFVVWHELENDGKMVRFWNGFIIPNHYDHSFAAFQELLGEARKAFPWLSKSDVKCLTVIKSRWCKGCPILHFGLYDELSQKELQTALKTSEGQKYSVHQDRMPDVTWN